MAKKSGRVILAIYKSAIFGSSLFFLKVKHKTPKQAVKMA
jgi:hypothetical protein